MKYLLLIFISISILSCTHSPERMPAASKPFHNPEHAELLTLAANNKILMIIPDLIFNDTPTSSIGSTCQKIGNPTWASELYTILRSFKNNPEFFEKIHVIEFKRGDTPNAVIDKDLDGTSKLIISYSKTEERKPISQGSDLPCDLSGVELEGKDLSIVGYTWPSRYTVISALETAPRKSSLSKMDFNHKFLAWLAKKETVFNTSPELINERYPNGDYYFPNLMNALSSELQSGGDYQNIQYWLYEISNQSKQGKDIVLFTAQLSTNVEKGIHVKSVSAMNRKLNNSAQPTFLFMNYKTEGQFFKQGTLGELDSCLNKLTTKYRILSSTGTSFDLDPHAFMYPGHFCE